jgi:hypothetical protein
MRRFTAAAALAALALVFVPAAAAWTWPAAGDVVQQYTFDPAHPYAAGQHRGIDIAGDPASTVVAPAAGAITFAGTVPSSGRSVTITTTDGYAVTLTHLGNILVANGASIAEGAAVGTIGPSGDAEVTVPYVHLGIRVAADDQGYVDPLGLLPPRSAPPAPAAVTTAVPDAPGPEPQPAGGGAAAGSSAPVPAPAVANAQAAAVPAAAPAATPAETVDPGTVTTPRPSAAAIPVPTVHPAVAHPRAATQARSSATLHAVARPHRPLHVTGRSASPTAARPLARSAGSVHRVVDVAPAVHEALPARHVRRAPPAAHAPHLSPARPKRRTMPRARAERLARRVVGPVAVAPIAADARRISYPSVVRRRALVVASHHVAFLLPVYGGAAALALALLLAAVALLRARVGVRRPVRMIAANVDTAEEGLGSAGMAVRLGPSPPWTRGGLRGSVGRVRPLPPAQGRRRAHGQRYGRARYAGDGRRGSRGKAVR